MNLKKATTNYNRYHWGRNPDQLILIDKRIIIPSNLVELGILRGVLYQTSKKGDPDNTIYIHTFKDPCPYLVCDSDMKNLYIIGGSYKIEDRGIVD